MPNEVLDIHYKEYESLRAELRDLKECQIRFLTIAVTATGIILGLVANFNMSNLVSLTASHNMTNSIVSSNLIEAFSGFYFLIPLTIVLPAWFIFFDKATTITRAVAYFRLLEGYILNEIEFEFRGFENSLADYRNEEKEGNFGKTVGFIGVIKYVLKKLSFGNKKSDNTKSEKNGEVSTEKNGEVPTSHASGRYWFLVTVSFFGLTIVCWLLALMRIFCSGLSGLWLFIVLSIFLIITIVFVFPIYKNIAVYMELTAGRHSYMQNYENWKTVFRIKNDEEISNQSDQ